MRRVVYTRATDDQVRWGGCDDPRGLLNVGAAYEVARMEVHSFHTKFELAGFDGKRFNSVCFKTAEKDAKGPAMTTPAQPTERSMDDTQVVLQQFQREVERCFDLAQLLDSRNPNMPGAFTGTPSERIARHLAAAPAPAGEPVAWQWQHFLGNPDVVEPFWTEWEMCTKEQYEYALATPDHQGRALCVAPPYAAPPAPAGTPSDDARDAARYRWLRSIDYFAEWSRAGHFAADALDSFVDAAIASQEPKGGVA